MGDEIISAAVDGVSRAIVDALARGAAPTADGLRLLLRAWAATGRDEFRDALEPALAAALEIAAGSPPESAASWLVLCAEAAEASDDARLRAQAPDLAAKARTRWGATRPIAPAARSIEACLRAGLDIPAAVDELERIVSSAYEPGEGVGGPPEDEVALAAALLTAFLVTGRLPYAMLAEELIRHARRTLPPAGSLPFALGCETSAVLARLAALHRDDDYRTAAVVAPGADYAADAARMLEGLAAEAAALGPDGAAFGLAAGELAVL